MIGINDKPTPPAETAAYIEHVTTELRDLAHRTGLPFLGYLIDMARLEAASQSARAVDRRPGLPGR